MRSVFSFCTSSSLRNMSASRFEMASLRSLFVASICRRFSSEATLSASLASRSGAISACCLAAISLTVCWWSQNAPPMTSSAVRITAGICSLNFCHMGGRGWLCGGRLVMDTREMQRRYRSGFCSCFSPCAQHVGEMSLNRCEQRVFDYLQSHPEERQFWQSKVQTVCRRAGGDHAAAAQLDGDLWDYYKERSAVASPFKEAARIEGLART